MIIGLSGLAGAGKTTAARILEEEAGYDIVPFAGPLKAMTRAFGLTAAEMAGELKESPCDALCGKTPRQFMQWLGTEFGRHMVGPDIWVNAWRRNVERAVEVQQMDRTCGYRGRLIVADDVRFDNEAAAIRAMGGRVIRIERPGAGSRSGAGHASELWRGTPDLVILNTGSEAELSHQIMAALEAFRERAA